MEGQKDKTFYSVAPPHGRTQRVTVRNETPNIMRNVESEILCTCNFNRHPLK